MQTNIAMRPKSKSQPIGTEYDFATFRADENVTFYTYASSCAVKPKVPGKKSFMNFSMSLDVPQQIVESEEA